MSAVPPVISAAEGALQVLSNALDTLDEARQLLESEQKRFDRAYCELLAALDATRRAPTPKPTTPWADNPQAAQIDALVERAGRLTDAEIDALGAAWGASGGAAWATARYAAWNAAWGAARYAAQYPARDAARRAAWGASGGAAWGASGGASGGAAWGASGGAARRAARSATWDAAHVADALVVRDLIDEATPWNQAAYDLLVAPWAAVVGPAHPDDVQAPHD